MSVILSVSPYKDSVNTKKAGCKGFLDVKEEDLPWFWGRNSQKRYISNELELNWFFPKLPDPFQIRSSFLEKDLDPVKIQKKWSAIRIWNCCVQFLTMYDSIKSVMVAGFIEDNFPFFPILVKWNKTLVNHSPWVVPCRKVPWGGASTWLFVSLSPIQCPKLNAGAFTIWAVLHALFTTLFSSFSRHFPDNNHTHFCF